MNSTINILTVETIRFRARTIADMLCSLNILIISNISVSIETIKRSSYMYVYVWLMKDWSESIASAGSLIHLIGASQIVLALVEGIHIY